MSKNNDFIKDLELEARYHDHQFQDLYGDFVYVVELNRELSMKYQELLDCFPKVAEIDLVIERIENSTAYEFYNDEMTVKDINERLQKLKKFRSALVMLEKNDPRIKPPKYDDLEKENNDDDVEVLYDE